MPLARGIIVALLVVAALGAVWDWRFRRIPNWLTLSGLIAGFALNVVSDGLMGLERAGLGMLIAFGVYLVLYLLHAKAAGDVKLMAAIGSFVGWREWFIIFFVSSVVGAAAGLFLAWKSGRLMRTFNNVGFILSEITHGRAPHVRREDVDVKSEKALRIPGGTVVGVGVFIVIGWTWWTP
jgi:prepilin peptidase CpaA